MKKIVKIVTFYDDGSFTEAIPSVTQPHSPYTPPSNYPATPRSEPAWPKTIYDYRLDNYRNE